jgi:hypothetical protein
MDTRCNATIGIAPLLNEKTTICCVIFTLT